MFKIINCRKCKFNFKSEYYTKAEELTFITRNIKFLIRIENTRNMYSKFKLVRDVSHETLKNNMKKFKELIDKEKDFWKGDG